MTNSPVRLGDFDKVLDAVNNERLINEGIIVWYRNEMARILNRIRQAVAAKSVTVTEIDEIVEFFEQSREAKKELTGKKGRGLNLKATGISRHTVIKYARLKAKAELENDGN